MALATGEDLIVYYDARTLGTMLSDDNTTVDPGDVPHHPVVESCMSRASGQVKSALNHCKRYSDAELDALVGDTLEMLKGIVCDIAVTHLQKRRITLDPTQGAAIDNWVGEQLERLRKGEHVFSENPQQSAGLADVLEVSADTIHRGPPLLRDQMSGVSGYFPKPRYKR